MKKTTSQIVAVEGWGVLFVLSSAVFVALLFGFYRVGFLLFVAVLFAVFYFRNLEKTPDERDGFLFLAPIDGVVKSIEATNNQTKIIIANRIVDEHTVRMPTQGALEIVGKQVGIAANLVAPLNALANRTDLMIKSASNGVDLMVRFSDYVKDLTLYSDKKTAYLGERIGFFYGGEVLITAPKELQLAMAEGAEVRGGKTVMGYVRTTGEKQTKL